MKVDIGADERRARILVAEGDRRTLGLIRRALADDADLIVVGDASDLIDEAIATPPPDLILIDASRPDLDGFSVCRALKSSADSRSIPVLFLIDRKEWRHQVSQVFQVGGADHVRRPFESETLRARIQLQLELSRLRAFAKTALALDPVTDVAEQRGVEEYIDLEWKRALREATPLSLVVTRIDAFSAFHEARGSVATEDCLRTIATELTAIIRRPMDFLGRWEDDGFAVVLPVTEGAGARYLAELMRQGVETLTMPHPCSKVSSFVTLSIGVATTVPYSNSDAAQLVSSVRQAVEKATLSGGNTVRVIKPETS